MQRRIANEIVFWLHFSLIPFWITFSILAAPLVVMVATAAHQAHLRLFKGCALTHFQRWAGDLQEGRNFFETAFHRFFHRAPSGRIVILLNRFVWIFPLTVALIKITL